MCWWYLEQIFDIIHHVRHTVISLATVRRDFNPSCFLSLSSRFCFSSSPLTSLSPLCVCSGTGQRNSPEYGLKFPKTWRGNSQTPNDNLPKYGCELSKFGMPSSQTRHAEFPKTGDHPHAITTNQRYGVTDTKSVIERVLTNTHKQEWKPSV
jgi:hypothetical protein